MPGREGSAAAPAADVEEVEPGTASTRGAAVVPPPDRVRAAWVSPATDPSCISDPGLHLFVASAEIGGEGWRGGGRGARDTTSGVGEGLGETGFYAVPTRRPAPFSLRLFAVSCSLN